MKLFIFGVITAWILEFLFYILFIKKKPQQMNNVDTTIQSRTSVDVSALNNRVEVLEKTIATCKEEQAISQAKLAELEAELASKTLALQDALKQQEEAPVVKNMTNESGENNHIDDLTVISGIGPKLHEALNECGIHDLNQLIAADIDKLIRQLKEKGIRFSPANAQTWIQQATLAVQDDMTGLKELQEKLRS